jgi:hypothetical protein
MPRSAPRLRSVCILAALLAAGACTDRNPASAPEAAAPALPPSAVAMLTCTVSVRDATLACRAPETAAAPGVSAAILGGQGEYVRLSSANTQYDGSSVFRTEVTLENLTAQALGTANGSTPSPEGVRVFFNAGPIVTAGSGTVEVANEDGEAFFTAAGQEYFRYDGILPPGSTTAAREWRFSVPATVTSFSFGVLVAAPVRGEGGWLSVSPLAPSLPVGDTLRLAATLRNSAGGVLDGAPPATWTSADSGVVTVDSRGLLRAKAAGKATVTAGVNGRTASVDVHVYADSSNPLSSIVSFRALESTVTADGVDSVRFEIRTRGAAVPPGMAVRLLSPNGFRWAGCSGPVSFEGAANEGTYRCATTVAEGWPSGAWRVDSVTAGAAHGRRGIGHAGLLAAGAQGYIYVNSPAEDRTPPELHVFTLSPTTIRAGVDVLEALIIAGDQQSGLYRAGVIFSSPGNPRYGCTSTPHLGQSLCRMGFAPWLVPGTWKADSVWVQDENGNRLVMTTAQLDSAGFPTQFTMTGTNPDTVPPQITAFSFSPDTVAGNGVDSVTVTLTATEPQDASGVWFLDMEFEREDDTSVRRRCLLNGSGRVLERTMTCKLAFGPGDAGAWRVRYIRAIDFMNLSRVYFTGDVDRAGFPWSLTITAP